MEGFFRTDPFCLVKQIVRCNAINYINDSLYSNKNAIKLGFIRKKYLINQKFI